MKFTPIASSSRGNAYLVESEEVTPPLLLEAGLPIRQLRDKLREHGVSITDLAGCLVSHGHGDHSKAVPDLLRSGVDCSMSLGTADALGVMTSHRFFRAQAGVPFSIYRWRVMPFALEHDAEEPLGFFVAHGEERLLFVPDTAYVGNRFEGITMAAIECNFQNDLLSKNILSGALPAVVGHRVRRSHMSLETVIDFLRANDLRKCRAIWLLHLSDGNSDEVRMKQDVQRATGIPTMIAQES